METNYFFLTNEGVLKVIPNDKMPKVKIQTSISDFIPNLEDVSWGAFKEGYKTKLEQAKQNAMDVTGYHNSDKMVIGLIFAKNKIRKLETDVIYPLECNVEINPRYRFFAGNYSNICSVCKNQFNGCDKRQFVCKPCSETTFAFISVEENHKEKLLSKIKSEITKITDSKEKKSYKQDEKNKLEEFFKENKPDLKLNFPSDQEIYKWLQENKFQTEMGESGEYKMLFEIDMPKILKKFNDDFKSSLPSTVEEESQDKLIEELLKLYTKIAMDSLGAASMKSLIEELKSKYTIKRNQPSS